MRTRWAKTLARKRREHSELCRRTVRTADLRCAARREGILVTRAALARTVLGRAMGFDGSYGVILNTAVRSRRVVRFVLAHELAHIWLHLNGRSWQQAFASYERRPSKIEREADDLAIALLGESAAWISRTFGSRVAIPRART